MFSLHLLFRASFGVTCHYLKGTLAQLLWTNLWEGPCRHTLVKMVGLQVTPSCPLYPPQTGLVPNLCPSLLHTLWRGLSAAPCITEPGQERSKVVGNEGAHPFCNLPCALTSLPSLPLTYGPFSFGLTSPDLKVSEEIFCPWLLYLSLWLCSSPVPLLYSGPHPLQVEAIPATAVYFRGENNLGEISFWNPYLIIDLTLNEWARHANKTLRNFLITSYFQVVTGLAPERRLRKRKKNIFPHKPISGTKLTIQS